MNRHTKGPWHVGVGNGEGSIFADSGRTRLESGGTTLYPICEINSGWDESEDAANARLIASAPELLAAAEAALGELEGYEPAKQTVEKLYAAVRKATGVQS
jgi:hypothetical protein